MANPVFTRLQNQTQQTPNGYPAMPGYQPNAAGYAAAPAQPYNPNQAAPYGDQPGYPAQPGYPEQQTYQPPQTYQGQQPEAAYWEQAYQGPAADAIDRGRMTHNDVVVKTGIMFGVLLVAAFVSWVLAATAPGIVLGMVPLCCFVGFVLAMVNIFKREPVPALMVAYAAVEGLFLGAISMAFEMMYPGVVMQAIIASLVTFGVAFGLYATGTVRNSRKLQMFSLIGFISFFLFSLLDIILVMSGVVSNPWGIAGGTIFGIPTALIIGLVVVVLATISLIGDLDACQQGVEQGIPSKYAWSMAFGLMVTLIWLYVQMLRLLAILSSDN